MNHWLTLLSICESESLIDFAFNMWTHIKERTIKEVDNEDGMIWIKCSQYWKVKVAPEIVNKDLFRGNASRIAGNARVPFTFTRRTRFLDLSKNHKRYCYRQVE